jgi:2-polyprenyl-3-methyl-5-hydroxy-6-metoxy-1,4-benzoquinol methylase
MDKTLMNYTELNACLACGHDELVPTLDLGIQPLANSYTKTQDEILPVYPLLINRCTQCHHVQLSVAVDPELMFKEYLYVSGTSKTMKEHFKWFANFSKEYYNTLSKDVSSIKVLDIGCNDGSQLDEFKEIGCETFGVDPAENLYPTSSAKHEVVCGYFDDDYVKNHQSHKPQIITAQNVFAHNYDPFTFMENVSRIMGNDSLFFVQTSQANMILNNEFDTIYHEHISFYNIKSMKALCDRAGLNLIDVQKTPLHGTSYIFVISKSCKRDYNVDNLIALEELAGLYSPDTYRIYGNNCNSVKDSFREAIIKARNEGYKLIGYGAAAKGNTFLNYTGVKLDYIIDDNPLKQGYFTPGSQIEIFSIDILDSYTEEDKILFIPLAWNFFKEISQKIKTKRNNSNDKFLKYFPNLTVE